MSGILKKIGKVFKQIIKSPIFKAVIIAAAIYFTAGIAAGAMGSAFAASLPGISSAAGAIGLGGVGAIPAVGAAALEGVGVAAGAAAAGDAAAATAAEAGAGAWMGGTAAADAVGVIPGAAGAAAADAAEAGAGAWMNGAASAADGAGVTSAPSSFGITDAFSAANKGKTVLDAAGKVTGSTDSQDVSGAIDSSGKTVKAPTLNNGSNGSGGVNSVLKYFDNNPTVAKAAMTFGSDALKTGVTMFAQKSQQDVADQRAAQTRQRIAAPILQNPATYNKGIVDAVAGTGG